MFRFFENLVDPYVAFCRDRHAADGGCGRFMRAYMPSPFATVFVAGRAFCRSWWRRSSSWLIYYMGRVVDRLSR